MKINIQASPMTLSMIAEATNGVLRCPGHHQPRISAICTDSREADAETLFCAMVGERVDGHNYIKAAMSLGCAAVLCEKQPKEEICSVMVSHTVTALARLAETYKRTYLPDLCTIAVTGSVGKTTTKECIAAVLADRERIFKKEGNFNSTIGLPLSVMEMSPDRTAAVLEMGMSGFGEIASMSHTVHPDVACIVNVGSSHMEHLGSREGIAKAKMEIIEGMRAGGVLLINGDEPLLIPVHNRCENRGIRCLRVSLTDSTADFYVENATAAEDRMTFDLYTPDGIFRGLTVPAPGYHMVWAAAFAAAVGVLRGMDCEGVQKGLSTYRPAGLRQNITQEQGVTFIEDCYNAAPESMAAALSVLKLTAKGRMIAVLGDMKELGDDTVSLHRAVGQKVAALAEDGREVCLVTVGDLGEEIARGAAEILPADCIFISHDTAPYDAVVDHLKAMIREGDTVLFKASRAMTLEVIAAAIRSKE